MSLALSMQEARIRVVAMDGRSSEASIFLHSIGGSGSGPETILSCLNDRQLSFLPVRIGEPVELINLDGVVYLEVEGRPPEVERYEEVSALRAPVALELFGGERLEGDLLYARPPSHSRVSDLLNSRDERFLLLVTPGRTLFVRRAAILRARELPPPA